MLNPRHTLTAFQKKMAEKDYDNHKKRLAEIQKPKKNMSEEKDVVMRSTFVDLHSKHVQFQTTEKISSLDKTNKVLLDKLVKISRNQKPALFKSTHWTGHPGTLNTTYRKKELERIALENESMAKRLISQHSSVDHKKLKLDFLKHQEFSKNAQKNTYSSPKLSAKLPPLQSPKLEESPKDLRIKNKVKQRISSESVSPAASKSQTLDKTQQAQPAIRVVDSIPANPNRESNVSLQPQQAQERKEAPTSRSSQPQEAVEASARQSDSRRESQVNENKQQEKQEVVEQGNEISRKTSTKTVGEGENQVQNDKAEEKAEEKAVEVKEKEKEEEEEGEKSEKEKVEEKQEVVNESQEVKKKEEESENKEVENKEKQENANA